MASNRKLASRCRLRHAHSRRRHPTDRGNGMAGDRTQPRGHDRQHTRSHHRRSQGACPHVVHAWAAPLNVPAAGRQWSAWRLAWSSDCSTGIDGYRRVDGRTTSARRGRTWAESLAALDWALRLASAMGGRVVVVHAVGFLEEGGYRPGPDVGAIVAEVRQRQAKGSDVLVDVINEDGAAADVIGRVATRENADLIVVGSRGRRGSEGARLGERGRARPCPCAGARRAGILDGALSECWWRERGLVAVAVARSRLPVPPGTLPNPSAGGSSGRRAPGGPVAENLVDPGREGRGDELAEGVSAVIPDHGVFDGHGLPLETGAAVHEAPSVQDLIQVRRYRHYPGTRGGRTDRRNRSHGTNSKANRIRDSGLHKPTHGVNVSSLA